jgi:DNA-binding response OmpR family regulator
MISKKLNALIVDDDEVARRMVGFALEREGFACELAEDGQSALAILDEQDFDLVVTDILMPKTHGHAVATELLEKKDRPIIVVHTSVLEPKIAKDLMARGVDDIVFKPTDYAAFAAKLCSLVSRRNKLEAGVSDLLATLGIVRDV